MKLIITYAICGFLTAIIAILERYHKGEFDPYLADEEDEVAIGTIAILWWLYLYRRFVKGAEE